MTGTTISGSASSIDERFGTLKGNSQDEAAFDNLLQGIGVIEEGETSLDLTDEEKEFVLNIAGNDGDAENLTLEDVEHYVNTFQKTAEGLDGEVGLSDSDVAMFNGIVSLSYSLFGRVSDATEPEPEPSSNINLNNDKTQDTLINNTSYYKGDPDDG